MSGLYNALFGTNNLAPLLLKVLDIDQKKEGEPVWPKNEKGEDWYPYDEGLIPAGQKYIEDCIKGGFYNSGRFRDIYLDGDKIILYTRNGGGNRDEYFYIFDILRKHPNYIRDYDDDFDCTYASIEFSFPKDYEKELTEVSKTQTVTSPVDKWTKLFSDLDKGNKSEETENALDVGKQIFDQIKEKL